MRFLASSSGSNRCTSTRAPSTVRSALGEDLDAPIRRRTPFEWRIDAPHEATALGGAWNSLSWQFSSARRRRHARIRSHRASKGVFLTELAMAKPNPIGLAVEAARRGNLTAFASLVEVTQDMAYAVAWQVLRQESDARDVVQ